MTVASRRGQGAGSVYQRADGRWVASVSLPGGRRQSHYERTESAAREWLAEQLRARDQGLPAASLRQRERRLELEQQREAAGSQRAEAQQLGARQQRALELEAQAFAAGSLADVQKRIRQLEALLPDEAAVEAEIAKLRARCADWRAELEMEPAPEETPHAGFARTQRKFRALQLLAEDEAKIADLEAALADPAAAGIRAELTERRQQLPALERLAYGEGA